MSDEDITKEYGDLFIEPFDEHRDLEVIVLYDSNMVEVQRQSGFIPKLPFPGRVYTSGYDVDSLHKACFKNKALLAQSQYCGCFYCLNSYKPSEIIEWVDGNLTAICPKCGIDSVIGDYGGVITE